MVNHFLNKVPYFGSLGAILLLSLQACAQEFVKTKVFDKTPDQVFAAAEKVVRQNGITLLEGDQRTRTLRLRLRSFQSSSIREQLTGAYATFTAESDLEHGRKTKASLSVGNVQVPVVGFPPRSMSGQVQIGPNFSKNFFKQLKKELKI